MDDIEREQVAKTILMDVLNAVEALYGQDGLDAVVTHARRANRVREDNNEMDYLEKAFAR
jgi:hypothetical protein